jgi:predicted transcriptional regulator
MELETLFTISKWEILTYLSKGKYSPLELSKKINTSIANVSQQLRLLEFAGLVHKEKVSQREAGKPRTLYFLANDFSHLVLVSKNYADKRLLPLTDHHRMLMRIWFIEDISLHYIIEKFCWKLEHLMPQLKAILVDEKGPTVYLVADGKDLEKKVQDTQLKDQEGQTRTIAVRHITPKDIGTARLPKEKLAGLNAIHDPEGIIAKKPE